VAVTAMCGLHEEDGRIKTLWGWAASALVILLVVQNRSTGVIR
jgi:hypothetical protein